MIKRGIILFSLMIFCLILSSRVWAEFQITPSISIRQEYNDNIFLTSRNEEDDFITNIYPAINLTYKANILTLSLDYGFNFRFFWHHSDQNETNPDNTQRGKLDSTLSLYKDIFFVKIFDEYMRVPIDVRKQVALDNPFVNLTDSNHFLINPYADYPLSGTLKARVGYSYENIWYKAKEGDNANNHTLTAGLINDFSQKVTASLFYSFLVHRPTITEDYNRQDAVFGISYRPGPRFSFTGEIGHAWFDYKKRSDLNSPTWKIQGEYSLAEDISLRAGYSQNFYESVNIGTYESKGVIISLISKGYFPISLDVFQEIDTYQEIDREDKSKGVTINAGLPITPKITARLIGTYTHYKFLPENEKVHRYGAGLSLDYALRITTVSIGYTYNLNKSTVDENDYKNNIVWVQAKVTF